MLPGFCEACVLTSRWRLNLGFDYERLDRGWVYLLVWFRASKDWKAVVATVGTQCGGAWYGMCRANRPRSHTSSAGNDSQQLLLLRAKRRHHCSFALNQTDL